MDAPAIDINANLFAQHIGIARALLEQFAELPKRMGAAIKEDELQSLMQEARSVWEGLWDQLLQARNIVERVGRDVSSYDAARRAAGDIWLHAVDVSFGAWKTTFSGRKQRTITWKSAPVAPASAAINALAAQMPEVVVPDAAPADIELRSSYKWISNYGALIAVAVIIALVVWTCS